MGFVSAVATAARAYDYDVLLLTKEEAAEGLVRVVETSMVDGAILMDVALEDPRVPICRNLGLPTVLLGVPSEAEGLTCVDFDFEEAARLSVRELAQAGHREIGLMGSAQVMYDRAQNFPIRFQDAFERECARRGVRCAIAHPANQIADVRDAFSSLRRQLPNLSGLVLQSAEPVYVMLLSVLREEGIEVPRDISVISAAATFPVSELGCPLSEISVPVDRVGSFAVELWVALVTTGKTEPSPVLLEPVFRDNQSVRRV
jgi:DNA-binding LacI/PurR family transcriptional regulator